MTGFVGIQEARDLPGLRLVLLRGLPSPWSQAAKGILEIKKIPYTRVTRTRDDPSDALEDWTGQTSFPAAMLDDEPPRTGWAEILLLAERLEPAPPLIPADPAARALCFGLAHEICGEMGLGWCRRLMAIDAGLAANPDNPISKMLGDKYGYGPAAAAAAPGRVVDVLRLLSKRLTEQRRLRSPRPRLPNPYRRRKRRRLRPRPSARRNHQPTAMAEFAHHLWCGVLPRSTASI